MNNHLLFTDFSIHRKEMFKNKRKKKTNNASIYIKTNKQTLTLLSQLNIIKFN